MDAWRAMRGTSCGKSVKKLWKKVPRVATLDVARRVVVFFFTGTYFPSLSVQLVCFSALASQLFFRMVNVAEHRVDSWTKVAEHVRKLRRKCGQGRVEKIWNSYRDVWKQVVGLDARSPARKCYVAPRSVTASQQSCCFACIMSDIAIDKTIHCEPATF